MMTVSRAEIKGRCHVTLCIPIKKKKKKKKNYHKNFYSKKKKKKKNTVKIAS